MFYLTFAFMMLTSWLQWDSFRKMRRTQTSQRRRHLIITAAFGFSFLLRAIFNTVLVTSKASIEDLRENEYGWAAFLFAFHLFCELIPMNMVFLF
jgi:hypothetical protein